MCDASFAKTKTKKQTNQNKAKKTKNNNKNKLRIFLNIFFFTSAADRRFCTDLAKQKEIEREKEELMDEGDFLEYKVNEEEFSKTCCKSRRSH